MSKLLRIFRCGSSKQPYQEDIAAPPPQQNESMEDDEFDESAGPPEIRQSFSDNEEEDGFSDSGSEVDDYAPPPVPASTHFSVRSSNVPIDKETKQNANAYENLFAEAAKTETPVKLTAFAQEKGEETLIQRRAKELASQRINLSQRIEDLQDAPDHNPRNGDTRFKSVRDLVLQNPLMPIIKPKNVDEEQTAPVADLPEHHAGPRDSIRDKRFDGSVQDRMKKLAQAAGGGGYNPGFATAQFGNEIIKGFQEKREVRQSVAIEHEKLREQQRAMERMELPEAKTQDARSVSSSQSSGSTRKSLNVPSIPTPVIPVATKNPTITKSPGISSDKSPVKSTTFTKVETTERKDEFKSVRLKPVDIPKEKKEETKSQLVTPTLKHVPTEETLAKPVVKSSTLFVPNLKPVEYTKSNDEKKATTEKDSNASEDSNNSVGSKAETKPKPSSHKSQRKSKHKKPRKSKGRRSEKQTAGDKLKPVSTTTTPIVINKGTHVGGREISVNLRSRWPPMQGESNKAVSSVHKSKPGNKVKSIEGNIPKGSKRTHGGKSKIPRQQRVATSDSKESGPRTSTKNKITTNARHTIRSMKSKWESTKRPTSLKLKKKTQLENRSYVGRPSSLDAKRYSSKKVDVNSKSFKVDGYL